MHWPSPGPSSQPGSPPTHPPEPPALKAGSRRAGSHLFCSLVLSAWSPTWQSGPWPHESVGTHSPTRHAASPSQVREGYCEVRRGHAQDGTATCVCGRLHLTASSTGPGPRSVLITAYQGLAHSRCPSFGDSVRKECLTGCSEPDSKPPCDPTEDHHPDDKDTRRHSATA